MVKDLRQRSGMAWFCACAENCVVFNTGPYTVLPDNSILITANVHTETGFPSSHQLNSYVASKSRLKLAAHDVLSADAGLLVIISVRLFCSQNVTNHHCSTYEVLSYAETDRKVNEWMTTCDTHLYDNWSPDTWLAVNLTDPCMTVIEVQRHNLLMYFLYNAGQFQCTDKNIHNNIHLKLLTESTQPM